MDPYLLTGLILVVSTIVIVVLWMNSKANSKSKNNDKQAYATQKTHPKAPIVSQTRTECAQTHVEDEVTVTDDNLLEQEVVWEEIEGVQIVDDGEQERHNEVPGETSNEVDTAEERQEEYYEEEDGNLGETRDSEIGADGGNESPRESESEISPATPEVSNSSMGKRSPPKRLITRTFSSEGARSVSPSPAAAGGKTMYKFGSHYKKGGDSWVMNQNSEATAAAASPVGVSPVRTIQLKKIIPVHNDSQPLSRKQSDKISQCE